MVEAMEVYVFSRVLCSLLVIAAFSGRTADSQTCYLQTDLCGKCGEGYCNGDIGGPYFGSFNVTVQVVKAAAGAEKVRERDGGGSALRQRGSPVRDGAGACKFGRPSASAPWRFRGCGCGCRS